MTTTKRNNLFFLFFTPPYLHILPGGTLPPSILMAKREVDIVVISDVHLGTYGCHAKELLKYLKSVKTQNPDPERGYY